MASGLGVQPAGLRQRGPVFEVRGFWRGLGGRAAELKNSFALPDGPRDGPASSNTFQFTGRENDGTGLYYYRARYYSPIYQRFISEDPARFSGGVNFYAYAGNDPVDFADPFGLKPPNGPGPGVPGNAPGGPNLPPGAPNPNSPPPSPPPGQPPKQPPPPKSPDKPPQDNPCQAARAGLGDMLLAGATIPLSGPVAPVTGEYPAMEATTTTLQVKGATDYSNSLAREYKNIGNCVAHPQ